MRPTRAEINIEHFQHNLQYVRERIGPRPKIMAIVKANAYGHGLDIIASSALETSDVHSFGVATEEEGVRLRRLTSRPILVLTGTLVNEIDIFLEHDLEFTVTDLPMLRAIAARARAHDRRAKIHVKIDTGMRRIGIEPEDTLSYLSEVERHADSVDLVGVMTHFATSDEEDLTFFRKQLTRFDGAIQAARAAGITIPLVHAANSGAILQAPKESSYDMVRPGIMLYGYAPSPETNEKYRSDLLPPLALVSNVVFSKRIKAGEGVSYGLRWIAQRDTTIATVPIGYGDGYSRLLTNRTDAVIKGKRYPVVGTICMDQIMIDLGDDEIAIGETVSLIDAQSTSHNAWSLAKTIGTIPYEVLTNIAVRVPRVRVGR